MHRIIENAKITKVTLGNGDGGPDGWIDLDMNGSGQGFGGYHLGGEAMSIFVLGVLNTLEVDDWSKLTGTYCRIDHDWGQVYRIGHIIKDKWFDPKEAFSELRTQPAPSLDVQLVELLRELVTGEDECNYDHHGYCQSHRLDPKPCPVERANALLANFQRED